MVEAREVEFPGEKEECERGVVAWPDGAFGTLLLQSARVVG